jgi:hypothetical protein
MNPNEAWANRQESSEEARREYERERLILWTLDSLADLMVEADCSKADVARKLGTSRSHITQVFSGSRNATLSTVADLAWACGKRAIVKFEPLRSGQFISQPVVLQQSVKPRIVQMDSRLMAESTAVETRLLAGEM